jgi:hypothetical protein
MLFWTLFHSFETHTCSTPPFNRREPVLAVLQTDVLLCGITGAEKQEMEREEERENVRNDQKTSRSIKQRERDKKDRDKKDNK